MSQSKNSEISFQDEDFISNTQQLDTTDKFKQPFSKLNKTILEKYNP